MTNLARRVGLAVTVLALMAGSRAEAGLVGSSVTGSLTFGANPTNFFNPANGFVPAGFGNSSPGGTTVTIANPLIEFGFQDSRNTDTANFTDTSLTVSDTSTFDAGPFTMTFTDSAFAGLVLTSGSNNFPTVTTASLIGNVLTFTSAGFVSAGTFTANFSLTAPNPVPEPATGFMAGIGAVAGLVVYRRRKRA